MSSTLWRILRWGTLAAYLVAVVLWLWTLKVWIFENPNDPEPLNVATGAIVSTLAGLFGWLGAKAAEASQSQERKAVPSPTNTIGDVHGGLIVTGNKPKVTIKVERERKVNEELVKTRDVERQWKLFQKAIGVSSPADQYSRSQFRAYSEIWRLLQTLRFAGEKVWDQVNERNIEDFSYALEQAKWISEEKSIFLDDDDYQELGRLLKLFEKFGFGKDALGRLYRLSVGERAKQMHTIQAQIQANYEVKVQYEQLLDKVRKSFRKRLSEQSKGTKV